MENSEIRGYVDNLYERLDELSFVTDKDKLLTLSTEFISEFMSFQSKLIDNLQKSQPDTEETAIETSEINDDNIETSDDETAGIDETASETVEEDNIESNTDKESEEEPTPETSEVSNDDTPAFAVFYSKNNASYISINEHKRCVLERNMAKAFYVTADANGIANGQNTLSRYDIDKYKPITIKFLTQKEFDDSIGRAISMKALMENMQVTTSDTIDSAHKVANFATNTKNSDSKGASHIGDKPKSSYEKNYGFRDGYTKKSSGYDFFSSKPYAQDWGNRQSEKKAQEATSTAPLSTRIESPYSLYKALHCNIDDSDVMLPCSMYRDTPDVTHDDIDGLKVNDINTVIELINSTLQRISTTQSGWLIQHIDVPEITYDYLMDFDYAMLDYALDEWNTQFDDSMFGVLYVEEFDPTVKGFVDNVAKAKTKYNNGESLNEWIEYAIYNFVRCIIAYDNYISSFGMTH